MFYEHVHSLFLDYLVFFAYYIVKLTKDTFGGLSNNLMSFNQTWTTMELMLSIFVLIPAILRFPEIFFSQLSYHLIFLFIFFVNILAFINFVFLYMMKYTYLLTYVLLLNIDITSKLENNF